MPAWRGDAPVASVLGCGADKVEQVKAHSQCRRLHTTLFAASELQTLLQELRLQRHNSAGDRSRHAAMRLVTWRHGVDIRRGNPWRERKLASRARTARLLTQGRLDEVYFWRSPTSKFARKNQSSCLFVSGSTTPTWQVELNVRSAATCLAARCTSSFHGPSAYPATNVTTGKPFFPISALIMHKHHRHAHVMPDGSAASQPTFCSTNPGNRWRVRRAHCR